MNYMHFDFGDIFGEKGSQLHFPETTWQSNPVFFLGFSVDDVPPNRSCYFSRMPCYEFQYSYAQDLKVKG